MLWSRRLGGRKRLRTSHFELNESDPYQLRTNTERRAPNSDRQRCDRAPDRHLGARSNVAGSLSVTATWRQRYGTIQRKT